MIRPVVEYASVVWDPITEKSRKAIEMVQRRAARMVTGDYRTKTSVTDMVQNLRWETLDQRRKMAKATMFFKTTRGLVDVEIDLKTSNMTSKTRGHDQRFIVPTSKINCHLQSFIPSTVRSWNNLPSDLVEAHNIEEFKRVLNYIKIP